MEQTEKNQSCRRDFLSRVLPVCAVSCLGAGTVFAKAAVKAKTLSQEDKHKFDRELPGAKMTYRQIVRHRYASFIRFARFLEKELGKERVIELIKKHTDEKKLLQAERDLKRLGKSDLKTYTGIFKDPRMMASITMEVIQDTDRVFEIKVTDCLYADSFLSFKAGDLGYAAVCWGDYIWASGFNPKIKLIRDKTLMQGHNCCNHKYVWNG